MRLSIPLSGRLSMTFWYCVEADYRTDSYTFWFSPNKSLLRYEIRNRAITIIIAAYIVDPLDTTAIRILS